MIHQKDYDAADVKFVQDMIPHHQMAVDMSARLVVKGQNAQVKQWAEAIFKGQREEIVRFKKWLSDRSLPETSGGTGGMK